MKEEVLFINNPKQSLDEIEELINIIYNGFMALGIDYGYHINNIFGQANGEKHKIYELRDNINYRIWTCK